MNRSRKKIDTLVIGNNIASFLTSAQILKNGHQAIYLKDQRIKSDDPYFKFFGPIDLAFIRTWVKDLELDDKIFKDSSFVNDPFYLKYHKKQILCASKFPFTNLMQLCRHFSDLYDDIQSFLTTQDVDAEVFNTEFLEYTRRMGESLCRYKTFHQVSASTFKAELPPYILTIYNIFKDHFKKNKQLQNILSSFRCVYTHSLETNFSDLESIYFFVLMLSPRYRFQWHSYNDVNASETISNLGGVSLEDVIEEFSFSGRRPWAAQLSSYTGVIAPRKVALFSSNLDKLDFGHNNKDLYSCVKLKYRLSDDLIESDYFIFDELSFGGEIMFIRKQVARSNNSDEVFANIKVYKKYEACLKYQFCRDDLDYVLRAANIVEDGDVLTEGRIVDDICLLRNHSRMNPHENVELRFRNGQGKFESVKGVYYQGPLKKNYLGITQTLLEARDFKTFI